MKKLYYSFFLLLISTQVFAQTTPKVTVANEHDLKLTDLKVHVEIVGNLAVTTYDMKFYNGLDRTLEGELVFPLGEGQAVSGFAMEVNGKMRDAVIVESELGRVAYEATIRRKIDPALLEKTEGNNYRARIYPIFSKKHKHIILKFEQELRTINGEQSYELPLGISEKLDVFSITMNVFTKQLPKVIKTKYDDFFFEKNGDAFVAKTTKKNHAPKTPVVIQISNKTNQEHLATYNGYFHFHKVLQPKTRLKKKPKKITILWDASYSMRFKDVANEVKLVASYLDYVQDVTVNFITFNNQIQTQKEFIIKEGNTDDLLAEIQNVQYDGGTKLNIFEDLKIKADEILLFSDGLGNLGDLAMKRKIQVYAINSLVSANHQSLIDLTTKSGGNYLNLVRMEYTKAAQLLKRETYQFLGITHNEQVSEIYPKRRVNVYQDFSISGKFSKNTDIELLFGYGGEVTQKVPVTLEASEGTTAVKRLWAKQKLKHLYQNELENKGEIIALATRYSLITNYTSMIILDRIEDYVHFKIKPPKELLAAYKEYLANMSSDEEFVDDGLAERKEELREAYEDLIDWYEEEKVVDVQNTTTEIVTPVTIQATAQNQTVTQTESTTQRQTESITTQAEDTTQRHNEPVSQTDETAEHQTKNTIQTTEMTSANINGSGELFTVSGVVTDDEGMPLPGANVLVKGTSRGATTDFDGNFRLKAKKGQLLVISYVGYMTNEVQINSSTVKSKLKFGEALEAVTVVGYGGSVSSAKVASAVSTVQSSVLRGSASGVIISGGVHQSWETIEMFLQSQNSLSKNNRPIYIIDGEMSNFYALKKLKREEIQQLSVLKNQQAIAIYGQEGRGGVVYVITKQGLKDNLEAIQAFTEKMNSSIQLKSWNSDIPYIRELEKETTLLGAHKKYIEIRDAYANTPSFYLDIADFFYMRNAPDIALTITTNLLEMDLNNYELLKAAGYRFEQLKQYELAVLVYEKVLALRPEEPQSYRDLALAYEYVGEIQKSYDLLSNLYDGELLHKDENGRFTGIEHVAFVELTRLVNTHKKQLKIKKKKRKSFKEMPVDVRIVIDWNHNDTDIDLWVFDPKGEKASYKNPFTKIGGRMSEDLTDGYGPEEFMLKNAVKGEYKIFVDHFADNMQKVSGPTILKVALYTNYGKENEEKKTIIVRLEKTKGNLEVGSLFFE